MAAQYHWIVFASANAVDAFLDAVRAVHGSGEQREAAVELPRIAAVGLRTAERLRAGGVDVTLVPDEFTADALVAALTSSAPLRGARVLLPRSEIGRDVIAEGLRAAGAAVTAVVAYRTVAEAPGTTGHDVLRLLGDGCLDAVTFTSGSSVRHFVQSYGADSVALLRRSVVAVIGPVTADAARAAGVRVDVQPHTYTTAGMVEALAAHFTGTS
jgi:uroporphyrinogen III methyltransferase/synthase